MEKKLQAKHIPDLPILEFLAGRTSWGNLFTTDYEGSVRQAMPDETPFKVALAKMRKLLDRGLVDGCGCGCRGDFEITEKGVQFIRDQSHNPTS